MLRWTLHLNRGPELGPHAAVAVGDEVYSFGGLRSNDDQIDVHVFNTVALRWRKLTPETTGRGEPHLDVPSNRWGHTAVLIEDIYIWGGCKYDKRRDCNILYAFDVDTHRWFKRKVSGTVPEERAGHSACVLEKVMFIHGGYTQDYVYINETYKLNTSTMVCSLTLA